MLESTGKSRRGRENYIHEITKKSVAKRACQTLDAHDRFVASLVVSTTRKIFGLK